MSKNVTSWLTFGLPGCNSSIAAPSWPGWHQRTTRFSSRIMISCNYNCDTCVRSDDTKALTHEAHKSRIAGPTTHARSARANLSGALPSKCRLRMQASFLQHTLIDGWLDIYSQTHFFSIWSKLQWERPRKLIYIDEISAEKLIAVKTVWRASRRNNWRSLHPLRTNQGVSNLQKHVAPHTENNTKTTLANE